MQSSLLNLGPNKAVKALVLVIVTLLGLVIGGLAEAQPRCESLFSSYGDVWSRFQVNKTYTKEVPFTSAVRNQGMLGTCHIQAMVAMLEQRYAHRTGSKIRISTQYLTMLHWIDQVQRGLMRNDSVRINMGATIEQSLILVLRYGLMPESAWSPKREFETNALATRMEQFSQNIIGRYRKEIEQTSNLRLRQELAQSAMNEIVGMFTQVVGAPKGIIEFNGKKFGNPVAFAEHIFPELRGRFTHVYFNPEKGSATEVQKTQISDMYATTRMAEIEKVIIESIDQGKSVYFAYEHNHQFVDYKTGVMSIGAFKIPENGAPLSRMDRMKYGVADGGHAVQIIGYDKDPKTGEITKLKILNSWGTARGDAGVYHMYKDYFRAYARGVMIPLDSSVGLPKLDTNGPQQLELPL
jgi:bleomycin hydrolase